MIRTCCIAMFLSVASLINAALTYNVTCTLSEEGDAVFKIKSTTGKTITLSKECVVLQLSKYDDFRSLSYVELVNVKSITTNLTAFKTLKPETLENGDYYWRAFLSNKTTTNNSPVIGKSTINFGNKEPETVSVSVDNTLYEEVELSNGVKLSIEPVWLRSDNSSTPLNRAPMIRTFSTRAPSLFDKSTISYIPYSHGMIVRDNIIYVCRGDYNPINWFFDKKQLLIDRYDMITGESLEPIVVTSSENSFYGNSAMGYMGEDSDGTIYFTTTSSQPEPSVLNEVNLYTVNPENFDGESLVANYINTFEVTGDINITSQSHIFTVTGSIADGCYKLWGSSVTENEPLKSGKQLTDKVFRWNVEEKNVKFECSPIYSGVYASENHYLGALTKVTPISDDYFYYHSVTNDDMYTSLRPSLYKFEEAECLLIDSSDDIKDFESQPCGHTTVGVSHTIFEGRPIIAFGHSTEAGTHMAIAEVTDDKEYSFTKTSILWLLNEEGFSTNPTQGCDLKFIASPVVEAAQGNDEEQPKLENKFMLAYLPNGGMALYNVTANNTTGIDQIFDTSKEKLYISGRNMYVGNRKGECSIYDMAGRLIQKSQCNSVVSLLEIASGLYTVKFSNDAETYKVLVK
ncbi:MAG: T9SS type A sorting domain-containing protein [Muribaculum sp.]|nr:T9SS type A sorting domain-containing protein [Muribaculaceae bacterium]MCM1080954.1 T9SS type A sorting domain-containing protein [Muribaculum sp.]